MTKLVETLHAGGYMVAELPDHMSRKEVTIAAEQTLVAGQVLGHVGANEGAITVGNPGFTGTGNGTLTKATPAYGAGVLEGTYRAVCVEKAADGGLFQVLRPDGSVDGDVLVGVAYDGQVKFTIADGSTDFEPGDAFTLAVSIAEAADVGQYKGLDLSANDGAEIAAAILFDAVITGENETKRATIHYKQMVARIGDLTWPAGITTEQKAAALAQLAAVGIEAR
jgi:hypothetical protein